MPSLKPTADNVDCDERGNIVVFWLASERYRRRSVRVHARAEPLRLGRSWVRFAADGNRGRALSGPMGEDVNLVLEAVVEQHRISTVNQVAQSALADNCERNSEIGAEIDPYPDGWQRMTALPPSQSPVIWFSRRRAVAQDLLALGNSIIFKSCGG